MFVIVTIERKNVLHRIFFLDCYYCFVIIKYMVIWCNVRTLIIIISYNNTKLYKSKRKNQIVERGSCMNSLVQIYNKIMKMVMIVRVEFD